MKPLAFDLGDTLVTYEGIALDWSAHYAHALTEAFGAAAAELSPGWTSRAEVVLRRYNTRLHPRAHEVPSRRIFEELFDAVAADRTTLAAVETAFFGYFQRRCVVSRSAL